MADTRNGEDDREQEDATRSSHSTGGDAPAAGSIEEREAIATDTDDLMHDDDEDGDDRD